MGFDVTTKPVVQNDDRLQNVSASPGGPGGGPPGPPPLPPVALGTTSHVDGHAAAVTKAPGAVSNPTPGLPVPKSWPKIPETLEAKMNRLIKQAGTHGKEYIDAILAKFGGNISTMF